MNIFEAFGIHKAESSLPYGMSSEQYAALQSHFGAMWQHQDDPWFNLGDKHSSDNAHEAFKDFTRRVGPWYARGLFGRVSTIPDEHSDIMNLPDQTYFYSAPNEWHTEKEFKAGVVGENHINFKDIPEGNFGPSRGRGHGVRQSDTHIYGSASEMTPYPRDYFSGSKFNPAPPIYADNTFDPRTELPFRPLGHLVRNLEEFAAYRQSGSDPANWPDNILETHMPNRTPDEVMEDVERWPGEHQAPPPPDTFDTDWWDSQMNKMLWKAFGIHKEESYKPPSYTLTLNRRDDSISGGEKSGHEHLGQVARRATRHLNENPNGSAIIDTSDKGKFMVRGGHGKTLTHLHHPQDSTTRKAETYHDLWQTQAEKDGKDFNFSKGNTYLTHDSMRDKFGDVNKWATKNYGHDHPIFNSILGEANRAGDTNSLRRMEHMQKGANFLKEKEHPDYWHINTQGLYDLHPDDHIKHMGSAYSDPREGLNLMLWKWNADDSRFKDSVEKHAFYQELLRRQNPELEHGPSEGYTTEWKLPDESWYPEYRKIKYPDPDDPDEYLQDEHGEDKFKLVPTFIQNASTVDKMLWKMFGIKKEDYLPFDMNSEQYETMRSHFAELIGRPNTHFDYDDDGNILNSNGEIEETPKNARYKYNTREAWNDFVSTVGPWYARGLYGRIHKMPHEAASKPRLDAWREGFASSSNALGQKHLHYDPNPERYTRQSDYSAPNQWHSREDFEQGVPGQAYPRNFGHHLHDEVSNKHDRVHDNHWFGSHRYFGPYNMDWFDQGHQDWYPHKQRDGRNYEGGKVVVNNAEEGYHPSVYEKHGGETASALPFLDQEILDRHHIEDNQRHIYGPIPRNWNSEVQENWGQGGYQFPHHPTDFGNKYSPSTESLDPNS